MLLLKVPVDIRVRQLFFKLSNSTVKI